MLVAPGKKCNPIITFLYIAAMLSIVLPGCSPKESPRNTPIVKVVKECTPSVVNISTERMVLVKEEHPYWKAYSNAFDEFFNQFAKKTLSAKNLKGIGSGVIVSKEGYIISNAHVVNMASKVYVILSDGTTCDATVPAAVPRDDLVLLKITPPKELKPIKLARDVMIGETVVGIGNPLGLENSVSAGIISGINRTFAVPESGLTYKGLIQTDVPINIGSSGGALLNLEGELVGINLAVISGSQNIGFAIPVSRVRYLINRYEEYLETKKK